MNATCLCLLLFATSLTAAADQSKTPKSTLLTVAPQTTVRYSQPWRPSGVEYSNAKELILVSREKQTAETSARVLITTEQRLNHEDALQRLRDIAESTTNGTVRFVEIGGWPAVVLEFMEPLAQPGAPQEPEDNQGEPAPDDSPAQCAIVAVAAGTTVMDFDITLAPGAPHALLQQAEEIASSSMFPRKGNPEEVHKAILNLQHALAKPPAAEQPSSNPQAAQSNTETIHPPNIPAMKTDKKAEESVWIVPVIPQSEVV